MATSQFSVWAANMSGFQNGFFNHVYVNRFLPKIEKRTRGHRSALSVLMQISTVDCDECRLLLINRKKGH